MDSHGPPDHFFPSRPSQLPVKCEIASQVETRPNPTRPDPCQVAAHQWHTHPSSSFFFMQGTEADTWCSQGRNTTTFFACFLGFSPEFGIFFCVYLRFFCLCCVPPGVTTSTQRPSGGLPQTSLRDTVNALELFARDGDVARGPRWAWVASFGVIHPPICS